MTYDPMTDPTLPFGHSAQTEESASFGTTHIKITCPMGDLSGHIESGNTGTARQIANMVVGEHMRQTEPAPAGR